LSCWKKNQIPYVIFKEEDRLMPMLCNEGFCVSGLDEINEELDLILAPQIVQ